MSAWEKRHLFCEETALVDQNRMKDNLFNLVRNLKKKNKVTRPVLTISLRTCVYFYPRSNPAPYSYMCSTYTLHAFWICIICAYLHLASMIFVHVPIYPIRKYFYQLREKWFLLLLCCPDDNTAQSLPKHRFFLTSLDLYWGDEKQKRYSLTLVCTLVQNLTLVSS